MYQKYYDLSSDDNDNDSLGSSSSSSSDDEMVDDSDIATTAMNNLSSLWGRSILHIDIDCFYVQCEEIDRSLRDSNDEYDHPLAIGQKHIVVTCNYAARSRGVTKLMSKKDAIRICPDIRIYDGSDLRGYRKHSRTVYDAFRSAVQHEIGVMNTNNNISRVQGKLLQHSTTRSCSVKDDRKRQQQLSTERLLPCKRNAMDEMTADLSTMVDKLVTDEMDNGEAAISYLMMMLSQGNNQDGDGDDGLHNNSKRQQMPLYVFGDDSNSSVTRLVEDQTGSSTEVVFGGNNCSRSLAPTRRNVHEDHYSSHNKSVENKLRCRKRLQVAVHIARYCCESIFRQTGFRVSAGISVSPMLAKLSVVKKPRTVNLLLPWRSPDLMYVMPLRKMHDVGSRTYEALSEVVLSRSTTNNTITVRDLLDVPRERIENSLLMMSNRSGNYIHTNNNTINRNLLSTTELLASERKCDLLLERCRGLDSTIVEDDRGGIPKTVSVEDSFRRGTITTATAVQDSLSELYRRLPLVIQDRLTWSREPTLSYPTTIRLTIRMVANTNDKKGHNRERKQQKPYFVTRSKQIGISIPKGKLLASIGNTTNTFCVLQDCVVPLIRQLLFVQDNNKIEGKNMYTRIDITRINLAAVNFQDVAVSVASLHDRSYIINANKKRTRDSPYMVDQQLQLKKPRDLINKTDSKRAGAYSNRYQNKRKNQTTRIISTSKTGRTSSDYDDSVERVKNDSRKLTPTRIDHFFGKK